MRRRYSHIRARRLEIGVTAPVQSDRCVFDLQPGTELAVKLVVVVHRECGALPSAIEIDVTLPLTDVYESDFQETKAHHGVVGAAPTTINRATELKRFDNARRSTQRTGALHATRGTQAVEAESGHMRGGVEQNVERICSIPGGEIAVSGPVEQRRDAPTDVKGPGACHTNHAIDQNHAKYEELE